MSTLLENAGGRLPASVLVLEERDDRLHYRLPRWGEEDHRQGKGPRPRHAWGWPAAIGSSILLLECSITGLFAGCCVPGVGTVQILMVLIVFGPDLCRQLGQAEVILIPGWLAFRRRIGAFRWTRWCPVDQLERLVIRLQMNPEDDGIPQDPSYDLIAVGRRRPCLPWFGEWDDLRTLAEFLAARCRTFRPPGEGGIPVVEEIVSENA
jgi:hypothetical protein